MHQLRPHNNYQKNPMKTSLGKFLAACSLAVGCTWDGGMAHVPDWQGTTLQGSILQYNASQAGNWSRRQVLCKCATFPLHYRVTVGLLAVVYSWYIS